MGFDNVFNIEDVPTNDVELQPPFQLVPINSNIEDRKKDVSDDYTIVRQSLNFQQQMMMEAAKIALEAIRNGEHPRNIEVFSGLMGQLTALNEKILKTHKDVKELAEQAKPQEQSKMSISADNVYITSPSELLDMYGTRQDNLDGEIIDVED